MDLSQRLTYVIIRVAAEISDRGAAAVAELGLESRDVLVLTAVSSLQPVAQRPLAERVSIDRTTMVQVVDHLERKGWLERRRNPSDRRQYDLTLTTSGTDILVRAHAALAHCEQEFVSTLSADERKLLLELLPRLPHKPLDFAR